MRKLTTIVLMGAVMLNASCDKYFDINDNPNSATSATPELILPLALTATASNISSFNSYGAQLVGYSANAGGYGGFGTSITYRFSSSDFQARWSTTYDNLEDYQTIESMTDTLVAYGYFNAVARIMKAYNYELLVDTYNDIPYDEALLGADNLTPGYTDAATVYVALADELDAAMAKIDETMDANANGTTVTPLGTSDVMFAGDMTLWKQFANTIKLRLIVHAEGKASFTNTTFDSDGFLSTDAMVDPGYTRDNGKQNPMWNTWGFSYTGSAGNKAWMPNTFVMGFYDGYKLRDSARGFATYYEFPHTPTNRLGHEGTDIESSPNGSFWYPGSNRSGTSAGSTTGVLKGPDAGMPIMLAAESYFLQAEAAVRNITSGGDAATLFDDGITASYNYTFQLPDGSVSVNIADSVAKYKAVNPDSYLVNFDQATSQDEQIEAIITQKYIALNFINSHEAWNEYRRTHYPVNNTTAGVDGYETFISEATDIKSSERADRLPTRILYPATEGAYNSANVPKGISVTSSFIFWALQ